MVSFRPDFANFGICRKGRALVALFAGLLMLFLLLAGRAHAITLPPDLSCTISFSGLYFQNVNVLSTLDTKLVGSITVDCRNGRRNGWVTVCPSIGYGSGGNSWNPRQMAHTAQGSQKLNFQLYDPATGSIWGSNYWSEPQGSPIFHFRLNSQGRGSWTISVEGVVFAGQTSAIPGQYVSTFSGTDAQYAYFDGYVTDCGYATKIVQDSFQIVADVAAFCEVSATDLDFGTVGLLTGPVDASGSIQVRCTRDTTYQISLSGGQANATSPDQRRMRNGAYSVRYGIYRDSARTLGWGDQPGNTVSGVGTGNVQVYTTHGRVFAQPTPPAGTYTDTIVVTVDY